MEDPETEESVTVHVELFAFRCARLRDVIETFVPFDSSFRFTSITSLLDLFGENPTSAHDPTPATRPLDILDQPLPRGKREVKINRYPDYAYILVSNTEMAEPEYLGLGHDEIRRIQRRR